MENFPPNFVEDFLKLHNKYRAIHNSPPLKIDDELNELAQEWAERLARKGILQYKSDPKYGENIYISPWRNLPYDIKPKDPLESWYREGDYYKYGDDDAKGLNGVCNFTQLVWKNTQLIGLGISIAINGAFYFVCFYYPCGNIVGQFKENVLPPIKEEKELTPEEAEFIQKIKSKINVVRSMERLYAVPSEQLRVWLVWLSKVGDMADEWHKWLRSHIDFVLRLSLELRAAEEVLILEEEKEEEKRREEEERVTEDVEEPVVTEVEEKKEDEVVEEVEEGKPSIVITEEVEEEQIIIKEWPVGIPWEHLGIEEEKEKPFDERLPIPKNEAEMKDFLRKFTHEATIHRSSFKHWKDTADQAVKEIGNRLVMATFLVQGKDPSGEVKKPVPKKVPIKPKKIKSVQKKAKKKKVVSPVRKTNGEPEETEDSKMELTSSKRKLEIRKMLDIDADDLVKDSARVMEPLPYFFYLKVEPDIDIAIEHDDEKVILADTERENITGDYQRLYFNLSDKPCKGGKPWIL
ncbi:uncharacterized protein LOC102674858 [Apis dorsata]|uniref:uncharacterized protein LOC102674858 n=1 Tax=Apis dorsata TaxID=7462 RepID=UPI001293AD02|nr:uncharacterized protein LOC102674858 [Apis dorsata]